MSRNVTSAGLCFREAGLPGSLHTKCTFWECKWPAEASKHTFSVFPCLYFRTHTSQKRVWLFRADPQTRPVERLPEREAQGENLGVSTYNSIQQRPQRGWRECSSKYPQVSRKGGLYHRKNEENFPRDHPHHARYPVGKCLKIGDYRI